MNRFVIAAAVLPLFCAPSVAADSSQITQVLPFEKSLSEISREPSASNLATFTFALPAQTLVAFASATNYSTAVGPAGIAVADFNGDGFLDVAVANNGSNGISLWLGRGDGTLSSSLAIALPSGSQPSALVSGDFNGDGKMDLAAGVNGAVLILLGNGDGTFQAASSYSTAYSGSIAPGQLVAADINNDGVADLVFPSPVGVGVFLGAAAGTFLPEIDSSSACPAGAIAIADLNQDGSSDLVIAGSAPGSPVSACLLLGSGTGTFSSGPTYSYSGTGLASVVLADFNGDGWPDLAVSQSAAGAVSVQFANGDGTYAAAITYTLPSGSTPLMIGAADLNADGRPDLFATNGIVGGISVLVGNGDGTFLQSQNFAAGTNSAFATFGDINADGRPDLLVSNQGDATISALLNSTLAISASSLSFGQQAVGTGSASQTITLTNIGSAAISIGSISLAGASPADFQISSSCNSSIGPADSCTAVITFAPTATGSRSANVTITDAAIGSPQVVGLSGMGIQAPTTSTISSSVNPSVYGQGINLLALVATNSTVPPTGSVSFTDAGTLLGIAPLSNGAASLPIAGLAAGAHSITVAYSGDANFIASSSTALSQNVVRAAGATSVSASSNPVSYGQPVTLTADVAPQYGGVATGSVTFYENGNALGAAKITANSARLSGVLLTTGAHVITATYDGDNNVAGSTSIPFTLSVNSDATSTTLVSSLNPCYVGQIFVLTVNVTSQYGTPLTGTVTFMQSSIKLATVTLSQGTAVLSKSFATSGTRSLTAIYSGDGTNAGSTSVILKQVVNALPAATTTRVLTSGSPSFVGQLVTFSAAITSTYGPIPDGEAVTFYDGTVIIGAGATAGGFATFGSSSLNAQTHTVKASYAGDSTFKASSGTVKQVVNLYPSSTTLTTIPSSSIYGQPVNLTAVVASTAATGTVTFKSGTTTLGTASLIAGRATLLTTRLSAGTLTIAAAYNGDAQFAKSTGTTTQTVSLATTTTTLASSLNPSTVGQSVRFTATVASPTTPASGSVTFFDGSTQFSSVTLTNGVAIYPTASLAAGTHNVSVLYSGTTNVAGSSAAMTETVSGGVSSGTIVSFETTWNGLARIYGVYTPKVLSPQPGMVVVLHPTTKISPAGWFEATAWEKLSDQFGFIVLWPISTFNTVTQSSYWQCFGCEGTFKNGLPDDSGYLRSIIPLLQAQYGVPPGRTFVAGMSSGAFMAERAAVELSDLIAAIAPVSGALYIQPSSGPLFVVPTVPNAVSVYELHGDLDDAVPYCGIALKSYWLQLSASFSMDVDVNFWSGPNANNCSVFSQSQPLCTNGQPTPQVNGQDATACKGTAEVLFEREVGVPHVWVSGTEAKLWSFFQTHGR